MIFLYLTLLPTLIALLLLFFNDSFKKRYDAKKTIPVLLVFLIGEFLFITQENWFIHNNSHIEMFPLKYILTLAIMYVFTPIAVLYVNKIYKEKTFFANIWVRIFLAILLLVLIVLPFLFIV